MWGQIALGIFADGHANWGGLTAKGLIYGDVGQFAAQVIGAAVAFAWAFGVAFIFFKAYDAVFGMRVPAEVELAGLDIPEMGSLGYAPDAEPYRTPAMGGAPA
jgi:Amt family ammonium transporter